MAGAVGRGDEAEERRGGAYRDPPAPTPRYRRRQGLPPSERDYESDGLHPVLTAVGGVVLAVVGIVVVVTGEMQGLALLGIGSMVVQTGLWTPYRVTLDDEAVVLRAVARRVRIPWDQLESVGAPWWDVRHGTLKWRRRRGLGVLTFQDIPDLHRMLVEIERRSPGTHVSS